jgi:hypothetical protein
MRIANLIHPKRESSAPTVGVQLLVCARNFLFVGSSPVDLTLSMFRWPTTPHFKTPTPRLRAQGMKSLVWTFFSFYPQ